MAISDKADLSKDHRLTRSAVEAALYSRISCAVWDVLDMLASGISEDEILEDYPYLEKADFPSTPTHRMLAVSASRIEAAV